MQTLPPAPQNRPRPELAERVLRRCYARSRHQAIVFDAVAQLQSPQGSAWRRHLLAEAKLLALGADAPDVEFRDWRNHWLFPRENYWGGAIVRAQSWYQNLVTALSKGEAANAAYCVGVLGHYVIDALHPFHTAQSEAENEIHLGLDAATEVLYAKLRRSADALPITLLSETADFLAPAIADGADTANRAYESLLAHFHFDRAVTDPAAGFDAAGLRLMTDVIARQISMLSAILERACRDCQVIPGEVSLKRPALGAALAWPKAALAHRRLQASAQRRMAMMFDELKTQGRITAQLPDEERAKRDLYAAEIESKRPKRSVDNVFQLDPKRTANPVTTRMADDEEAEIVVLPRRRARIDPPRPAPRRVAQEQVRSRGTAAASADEAADAPLVSIASPSAGPAAHVGHTATNQAAMGHAAAAMLLPSLAGGASNFRDRRSALSPKPSGGDEASAKLLAAIAGLSAQHAALLVGAGYSSLDAVAAAEPEKVCADLLAFATTEAGRAVLAADAPPDLDAVRAHVEAARASRAA